MPIDSHRHIDPDDTSGVGRTDCVFGTGPQTDWDAIVALLHQRSTAADDAGLRGIVGVGYHPWFLEQAKDLAAGGSEWLSPLKQLLEAHPGMALGEIGLDKLKGPPMEHQLAAFEAQLDLAAELARPVSVHCVRAWGPMLTVLTSRPATALPPAFVFHGFSGSPDFVKSILKMPKPKASRFWFGVAATTTGRLKNYADVIRAIPRDRVLLESDAHRDDDASPVMQATVALFSVIDPDFVASCETNAAAFCGLASSR